VFTNGLPRRPHGVVSAIEFPLPVIPHADRDPLRGPAARHAVTPRFVEIGHRQRLVR
jgi:hypothetical protein